MTNDDKDPLLDAVFDHEELAQLREASLSRGLKVMRQKRRRMLAARVSVMALPVLLLAVAAFHHQPPPPAAIPREFAPAPSKVEYITADQLFALFPKRSMALIGKPGHQKLIFLDDLPANLVQ